jgi:hypothetical protein
MLHPLNHDPRAVELHLCELRAHAAQERLARQAYQSRGGNRPVRWRQRLGALLIASGEALAGPTGELACPDGIMEPHRCA